jgi:hypothetical protein
MSYCMFAPCGPVVSAACSIGHGHTEASCCPLAACGLGRVISCLPYSITTPSSVLSPAIQTPAYTEYCLVTGANRTLGFETARILAQRGHRLLLICRNRTLGEIAAAKIARQTGARPDKVTVAHVDLGDLRSVERFCATFKQGGHSNGEMNVGVRCLVNNAGLIGTSAVRVNHLGHMALTLGLLEPLIRARGTVVNVASVAHATQGHGLGKRLSETLSGKRSL